MVICTMMDITEAYDVLHNYFSEEALRHIYRQEKFDGSISDSIEELKFNAKLLRQETHNVKDEKEIKRMREASKVFEDTSKADFWRN